MGQSYSVELKEQIIQEANETGNAALVARRHQLSPGMVRRWVRDGRREVGETQGMVRLADENAQLKRLVVERDLQIAILQDALRKKGTRR